MNAYGTFHLSNDLAAECKRHDDGTFVIEISGLDLEVRIKENYDFHLHYKQPVLIIWCADKLHSVDTDALELIELTEVEYISQVFIDKLIFVVCDTKIITRKRKTLDEVREYQHGEIIGNCHFDKGRRKIEFCDIEGGAYSYDIDSGSVTPSGRHAA